MKVSSVRGRSPVSDVDTGRNNASYQSLGWRMDADIVVGDNFRAVQLTPLHSAVLGKPSEGPHHRRAWLRSAPAAGRDDIDAAREDLMSRGVEVSEVFHLAGGRVPGPDPQGRSYQTYASFSDPDGNGWLLQEITTRLPGREWEEPATDVASRADLLVKRLSITTVMRRPMPHTTGGTGMPPTWARASMEHAGGGIADRGPLHGGSPARRGPASVHCGPPLVSRLLRGRAGVRRGEPSLQHRARSGSAFVAWTPTASLQMPRCDKRAHWPYDRVDEG